jgi:hypothetical protein
MISPVPTKGRQTEQTKPTTKNRRALRVVGCIAILQYCNTSVALMRDDEQQAKHRQPSIFSSPMTSSCNLQYS